MRIPSLTMGSFGKVLFLSLRRFPNRMLPVVGATISGASREESVLLFSSPYKTCAARAFGGENAISAKRQLIRQQGNEAARQRGNKLYHRNELATYERGCRLRIGKRK